MVFSVRLVVACVLVLAAPLTLADAALEQSRARWQASGIADYTYGYRKYCECNSESPPETVVTVRAREVVNVYHQPAGTTLELQADERNFQWYWTMEDLFGLIETGLRRSADVRVTYHPQLGYPTEVFVGYGTGFPSDDVDVRVTRLEPAAR